MDLRSRYAIHAPDAGRSRTAHHLASAAELTSSSAVRPSGSASPGDGASTGRPAPEVLGRFAHAGEGTLPHLAVAEPHRDPDAVDAARRPADSARSAHRSFLARGPRRHALSPTA